MGVTYVDGSVKGSQDTERNIRFLVDSGATYTLLPFSDWQAIELKPKRTMTFTLADGTTVERCARNNSVRNLFFAPSAFFAVENIYPRIPRSSASKNFRSINDPRPF